MMGKWKRWSTDEIDIIKLYKHCGSQFVVDTIREQTGIERTMSTVREKARIIGHPIKRAVNGWLDHCGKLRKRVPGGNKTISPDRQGLTSDQIKLHDGSVVSRAELMRLNMLGYIDRPVEVKGALRLLVKLDQQIYEVENNEQN